jgi:hypothetical protein
MRRHLFLALILGALAASGTAVAQQTKWHSDKTARHRVKANPCAQYGPGFVKVEGSDTCIKVGGFVQVEGGVNVGR